MIACILFTKANAGGIIKTQNIYQTSFETFIKCHVNKICTRGRGYFQTTNLPWNRTVCFFDGSPWQTFSFYKYKSRNTRKNHPTVPFRTLQFRIVCFHASSDLRKKKTHNFHIASARNESNSSYFVFEQVGNSEAAPSRLIQAIDVAAKRKFLIAHFSWQSGSKEWRRCRTHIIFNGLPAEERPIQNLTYTIARRRQNGPCHIAWDLITTDCPSNRKHYSLLHAAYDYGPVYYHHCFILLDYFMKWIRKLCSLPGYEKNNIDLIFRIINLFGGCFACEHEEWNKGRNGRYTRIFVYWKLSTKNVGNVERSKCCVDVIFMLDAYRVFDEFIARN